MAFEPRSAIRVKPESGAGRDQRNPAQRAGMDMRQQHGAGELNEMKPIQDADHHCDGEDRQRDAKQQPGLRGKGASIRHLLPPKSETPAPWPGSLSLKPRED